MVSMNTELQDRFLQYLREREYSPASILKYMRNFAILEEYADGRPVDGERLLGYRQFLLEKGYSSSTVNSALGTVNTLFEMLATSGDVTEKVKLRYERIQYQTFVSADKELTADEYERMARLADKKGDARLSMILQTLGGTGIRVSDVNYFLRKFFREGIPHVFRRNPRLFRRRTPYLGILAFFTVR